MIEQPTAGAGPIVPRHDYLSTACQHARHAECRQVCKFCPAACRCACHVVTVVDQGRDVHQQAREHAARLAQVAGPSLDEADRQALLLALAIASLDRPGWCHYLRGIAEKYSGAELFDEFRALNADRWAKDPPGPMMPGPP